MLKLFIFYSTICGQSVGILDSESRDMLDYQNSANSLWFFPYFDEYQ